MRLQATRSASTWRVYKGPDLECSGTFSFGGFMNYRRGVNKKRSARKFRRNISRTKAINMRATPMRGGFRL